MAKKRHHCAKARNDLDVAQGKALIYVKRKRRGVNESMHGSQAHSLLRINANGLVLTLLLQAGLPAYAA